MSVWRAILAGLAVLPAAACDGDVRRASVAEAPAKVARTAASCAVPPQAAAPGDRSGLVFVPGGETVIGSERFHAEEGPRRKVRVGDLWIDRHEVTNAQFAAFVRATGYKTVAERARAGAAVFRPGVDAADLKAVVDGETPWWTVDPDATWRTPDGRGSTVAGKSAHPVTQVAWEDALAYARWLGRDLPTEAEWERAARGGLESAEYAWGDDPRPGGEPQANHWQGVFPAVDTGEDGFKGVAPVGCFPPNGYGLYDMTGNVWEWVKDPWPGDPSSRIIKGGSWLCADNSCLRYRPASRQPGDAGLGTANLGFRTVLRAGRDGLPRDGAGAKRGS